MQQLKNELLETNAIAEVQLQYESKKVDFQPAFDKSVEVAKGEFAGATPDKAQVALRVAALLADYLETALRNRPAKTRAGRIIRFILRLFSGR